MDGVALFNFGKYKGEALSEVACTPRGYSYLVCCWHAHALLNVAPCQLAAVEMTTAVRCLATPAHCVQDKGHMYSIRSQHDPVRW